MMVETDKLVYGASKKAISKAVDALSLLLGVDVKLRTHEVRVIKPENILEFIGKNFSAVIGVVSKFEGFIGGYLMLMFDMEQAKKLLEIILNHNLNLPFDETSKDFRLDLLREIGNIVAGNLIGEIGNSIKGRLSYTIPEVKPELFPALVDPLCIDLAMKNFQLLFINSILSSEIGELQVGIILLLTINGGTAQRRLNLSIHQK